MKAFILESLCRLIKKECQIFFYLIFIEANKPPPPQAGASVKNSSFFLRPPLKVFGIFPTTFWASANSKLSFKGIVPNFVHFFHVKEQLILYSF